MAISQLPGTRLTYFKDMWQLSDFSWKRILGGCGLWGEGEWQVHEIHLQLGCLNFLQRLIWKVKCRKTMFYVEVDLDGMDMMSSGRTSCLFSHPSDGWAVNQKVAGSIPGRAYYVVSLDKALHPTCLGECPCTYWKSLWIRASAKWLNVM